MDKKYRLNPSQASTFIKACLQTDEAKSETAQPVTIEELFKLQLAEKCPSVSDTVSVSILDDLKKQMQQFAGCSIGEILTNPKADLLVIKQIKEYYKVKSSTTQIKTEQHISTAIYFAAIAFALTQKGIRITEYDDNYLKASFTTLKNKDWVSPEIQRLFQEASEVLTC